MCVCVRVCIYICICSKALISQSDYEKTILKHWADYDERSINKSQSIYDEMSHNTYICFQPQICNYQADMTISPLALNQSKLLKFFSI